MGEPAFGELAGKRSSNRKSCDSGTATALDSSCGCTAGASPQKFC
jgi:hypothetical protein